MDPGSRDSAAQPFESRAPRAARGPGFLFSRVPSHDFSGRAPRAILQQWPQFTVTFLICLRFSHFDDEMTDRLGVRVVG